MTDYQLGDSVKFTRNLTRRSRWDTTKRQTVKRWEPEAYPGAPEPAPREGIVIGRRTLSNGHNVRHGYDEPIEYVGVHYFRAYLVAYAMHKAPILVLPEHLEPGGRHDDRLPEPETITVPRPTVPHGPSRVHRDVADADYLRVASRRLAEGEVFGSNLSATLAKLLADAADQLHPAGDVAQPPVDAP